MTIRQVIDASGRAKVAVVATGGGAPGICILAGYLQTLKMYGILPSAWSGTSAGACVGHIISKDLDIDRLITILCSIDPNIAKKDRIGGYATWLLFHDHLYSAANVSKLAQLVL